VNILASRGERPRGSSILVARNAARVGGGPRARGGLDDVLGAGDVVDGLELEEEGDGRVRVVANGSGGLFSGLRLRAGDFVLSVDGAPVSSIEGVRAALRDSVQVKGRRLVPILTYNAFRRLKTTVMTAVCISAFKVGDAVGRPVNVEDMYDVQEKVSRPRVVRSSGVQSRTSFSSLLMNERNRAIMRRLSLPMVLWLGHQWE